MTLGRSIHGCAVLAALALGGVRAGAQEPAPPARLAPAALSTLREMSKELAGAEALTFDARRHIDVALLEGRNAAEDASVHVMIKRPNKVRADSRSNFGVRHFYFDGTTVTVYDETRNMYATAPVKGTIDQMVERLDDRFGFVPPVAEFVVNDPWARIRSQVSAGQLAGTRVIAGERCRQLNLTGENANAELWVSESRDLPCRLVATFTRIKGNPQVRSDYSNWNTEAKLSDAEFVFTPPAGARKIPMVPASEIEGGGG